MDYGELKSTQSKPCLLFLTIYWGLLVYEDRMLRFAGILYNKYDLLFYDFKKV